MVDKIIWEEKPSVMTKGDVIGLQILIGFASLSLAYNIISMPLPFDKDLAIFYALLSTLLYLIINLLTAQMLPEYKKYLMQTTYKPKEKNKKWANQN